MRVDLYLRWLFYVELVILAFLSVPFGLAFKRKTLGALEPILSQIQLVLWIICGFVGFIFASLVIPQISTY